ncbi:MAG: hypothetical protein ACXV3D_02995 [Halobacteriota archaeon]
MNRQKTALALIMVCAAVVVIAGCVSSNPSPSTSPNTTTKTTTATTKQATTTPKPTTTLSASEFNARYAKVNPNYTIVTPFVKTTNAAGHAVYSGTVILYRDTNTVTFELCADQADAQQTFQKAITTERAKDYVGVDANATQWVGSKPIPNNYTEEYSAIVGINDPSTPFSTEMGIGYNVETIEGTAPI